MKKIIITKKKKKSKEESEETAMEEERNSGKNQQPRKSLKSSNKGILSDRYCNLAYNTESCDGLTSKYI